MNNFDLILFDFDDTLWARDLNKDDNLDISIENIKLLNRLSESIPCKIISGNTYASIRNKINIVMPITSTNFSIWADANSTLYLKDEKKGFIKDFSIDDCKEIICNFLNSYNLNYYLYGYPEVVNIKIKPLNELERNLLVDLFNNSTYNMNISKTYAFKTGKTTVDILSKSNSKDKLLETEYFKYFNEQKSLYIGDECNNGNDTLICKKCSEYLNVDSVKETNTILKMLLGD